MTIRFWYSASAHCEFGIPSHLAYHCVVHSPLLVILCNGTWLLNRRVEVTRVEMYTQLTKMNTLRTILSLCAGVGSTSMVPGLTYVLRWSLYQRAGPFRPSSLSPRRHAWLRDERAIPSAQFRSPAVKHILEANGTLEVQSSFVGGVKTEGALMWPSKQTNGPYMPHLREISPLFLLLSSNTSRDG
jgi:hypothetical protein